MSNKLSHRGLGSRLLVLPMSTKFCSEISSVDAAVAVYRPVTANLAQL